MIDHEKFNQSATYYIESNLINFFIADNRYHLQNVRQTNSREMHNYYEKPFYNEEVFQEIWEKLRNHRDGSHPTFCIARKVEREQTPLSTTFHDEQFSQ
ncbi:hypothetical protein AAEO50_02430 [Rossellomorea oryzaecorticis]|uniref:Uncharacterized protein n=1 Tax=Rossellomorea oryzaecorticis TaxID=1396505 RepID=A0ABU9K5X7_9BACI